MDIEEPYEEIITDDLEDFSAYTIANEFPTPRDRNINWACHEAEDPDIFFPVTVAQLAEAQAVCLGCSALAVCGQLGRDRREWGVWGGVHLEDGLPATRSLSGA